jgi:hypothetical protein
MAPDQQRDAAAADQQEATHIYHAIPLPSAWALRSGRSTATARESLACLISDKFSSQQRAFRTSGPMAAQSTAQCAHRVSSPDITLQ